MTAKRKVTRILPTAAPVTERCAALPNRTAAAIAAASHRTVAVIAAAPRQSATIAAITSPLPHRLHPLLLLLALLSPPTRPAAAQLFSHGGVSSRGDTRLEYYIREELPARTVVGNGIIVDYELDQKYPAVVLGALRFSLLAPAAAAQPTERGGVFVVDERRGYISTREVIDRDLICPGADQCIVSFDVAVLPIEYFHNIKVKVSIA